MKNNLIKIYSTLVCFFLSVALFAQPGSGSDTGNLEGGDVAAPIDSNLYILVTVGIAFAAYSFSKKRKLN